MLEDLLFFFILCDFKINIFESIFLKKFCSSVGMVLAFVLFSIYKLYISI